MDTITVSEKDYDEALTKALIALGITSDKVDIEVLEEGTSGFLGLFGGKPWRIKVSLKKAEKKREEKKASPVPTVVSEPKKKEGEPLVEKPAERPVVKKPDPVQPEAHPSRETHPPLASAAVQAAEESSGKKVTITNDELEAIKKDSETFLGNLFQTMGLPVHMEYSFSHRNNELSVNLVSEEDMGIMIGKRGQTLDSLQYLLGLVINKNTQSYIRVKLDTEDYRNKRRDKLEVLAKNIASKVKKTGKPYELEPMNPYERRIIHAALQGETEVSTKSVGEDPFRYIIILPKNRSRFHKKGNYRKHYNPYSREKTEE